MRFVLDLIWNHHVLTMASTYVVLCLIVLAFVARRGRARIQAAEGITLALLFAFAPWLAIKIGVHEYLGGHAISIAARMPVDHPQLAVYERAREVYDVSAMSRWARYNRDPVGADALLRLKAALEKLPPSAFKHELEAEIATGYVSKARFEAAALSIVQMSLREMGIDPAFVDASSLGWLQDAPAPAEASAGR